MQTAANSPVFPRGVVLGAGALMLFTIVVAGTTHATNNQHIVMPPTTQVASRDLLFADRADGGVIVTDAATKKVVTIVEPTKGGFLRGIMRGLVREHRLAEQAPHSAFRLTRWADGRLSIADPTTRESFELEAFGSTNEAVFARLLDDRGPVGQVSQNADKGADGR